MHAQGRLWFGILLILIGALLLLDTLRVLNFKSILEMFWPLLLVALGLFVIFRVRSGASPHHPTGDQQVFGDLRTESAADSIHHSTVFGDLSIRATSSSFRGGVVSTVFGDTVLDLSGTTLADGEQTLTINGVFGECSVRLPRGTAYSINAHALFGSLRTPDQQREGVSSTLSYDSSGYASAPKRLKIGVSQVFGAIRIEA